MTLADLLNLQQWIGAYKPAATPQVYQYSLPVVAGFMPEGGIAKAMFGTGKAAVAAAPKVASAFPTWAKVAGAGIGVGASAFGLSALFGGGGKTNQQPTATAVSQPQANPVINPVVTVQPVVVQPNVTNYFLNQYNIDKSQNWFSITNSPGASINNRKQMNPGQSATNSPSWATPFSTSTPISVPISQPTTQTPTASAKAGGTDYATIAAVLGVALVAYGMVTHKGGK
jgi:hypothetical protein